MARPNPDSAYKDIASNKRAALKVRIEALTSIARPSVAFLSRLARDKAEHPKVRMLAATRLDVVILLRSQLHKEKPNGAS
jgi:hypothetical protein